MESVVLLPANSLDAAVQIIDAAERKGVRLRLFGGLAFKKVCPSSFKPPFYRENKDIDLMGKREDAKGTMKIMETLGYTPREIFNKLNMGRRYIYYDVPNRRRVDIFLDELAMCHKFNFRESILPNCYALPITDLVMTKLQVVEMTEKEELDLVSAFHDYDVGAGGIEGQKISDLCSKDWGLYTTFTKSLGRVKRRAEKLAAENGAEVVPRVERLQRMMDNQPKSLAWRVRSKVGEKAKWYELPESDGDVIFEQSA